ncbi:hypothetical protein BANRA_01832 [Klebsiella pneumoniae]|nr:hypothetical protein BANRA_01832 [Klebsiella pneumoniae]
MTTDITKLAQSLKAAATDVKETAHIARYVKATIARETFKELMTPENILALVEALEKSQATEAHCNRGWSEAHEQEARAEAAEKRIAELDAELERERKITARDVSHRRAGVPHREACTGNSIRASPGYAEVGDRLLHCPSREAVQGPIKIRLRRGLETGWVAKSMPDALSPAYRQR